MIEERIEEYKRNISKCETAVLLQTFGLLMHNNILVEGFDEYLLKMDIIEEEILKRTGERK